MLATELERGFDDAKEQWNAENKTQVGDEFHLTRLARYFFWAGAQFGAQETLEIHAAGGLTTNETETKQ